MMLSPLIDVIGTVDSRFGRRMREPVTTMPAPWSALAPLASVVTAQVPAAACSGVHSGWAVATSAANAGAAKAKSAAEPMALVLSKLNFVIFRFSPIEKPAKGCRIGTDNGASLSPVARIRQGEHAYSPAKVGLVYRFCNIFLNALATEAFAAV